LLEPAAFNQLAAEDGNGGVHGQPMPAANGRAIDCGD
jgi:hypothetical protein